MTGIYLDDKNKIMYIRKKACQLIIISLFWQICFVEY
jgi:hypothetical protein